MAVTSSSTDAEILAQYIDNCDWEGSPAKAVLALQAARILTVKRPASLADGDGQSVNYESLASEILALKAYVALTSTASAARKTSFTRGKMLL